HGGKPVPLLQLSSASQCDSSRSAPISQIAMNDNDDFRQPVAIDPDDWVQPVGYDFGLSRRGFVQFLSAGLVITASAASALGQRSQGRGGQGRKRASAARIHIGKDGKISVLSGKVEMGQGARAELTQAAAEELHVPASQIEMILADTAVVPDDGITAGSR